MTVIKVSLLPQAMDAIQSAAQREDMTRTDVINRAVQLYDMIGAAEPGTELIIDNTDGTRWMTVVKAS